MQNFKRKYRNMTRKYIGGWRSKERTQLFHKDTIIKIKRSWEQTSMYLKRLEMY